MSEEQFSVEQGRTAKLTFTVQRDWCDLMPISHGAARMFRILRSMMVETKDGTPRPTRALTIDQLCWMMSSFTAKPVGEQTVRDYRRELTEHGMLDVLPGRRKNDPPRYVLHDLPPEGWDGWRNAWHVDGAYHPDWRTDRPQPSDTESENGHSTPRTVGGCEENADNLPHGLPYPTDHRGVPHGVSGGIHGSPGGTGGLTCGDGAPNKAFKEASNQSSSSSGSRGAAREEEEEAKTPPPAARPAAELHPDARKVIEMIGWPKGKEPRGRTRTEILRAASCALEGGWGAEPLAQTVNTEVHWDQCSLPARVVLKVLREEAPYAAEGRTGVETSIESLKAEIEAQKAAVASCGVCDETGWTSDGWHGHGRRGMTKELRELENPDQVAMNKSLNSKNFQVA